MNPWYRRVGAIVAMVVGTVAISMLTFWMNDASEPPRKDAVKSAADFKVEKQREKKPQQAQKPRSKPRQAARTAQRAPAPNITTQLSGLSFDLPQFENQDLLGTDKLLSGAAGDKKLTMTEDAVDSLPEPRNRKSPEYPARARERGIQGHVLLKIKVSELGEVEQVRVVEAQPAGVFEDVAVAAVRQWTFQPATYKGSPVAVSVSQKIPFRLN
jgi:periplasmic protein TonB